MSHLQDTINAYVEGSYDAEDAIFSRIEAMAWMQETLGQDPSELIGELHEELIELLRSFNIGR